MACRRLEWERGIVSGRVAVGYDPLRFSLRFVYLCGREHMSGGVGDVGGVCGSECE